MLHAGGSHDGLFFEPTALGRVRAGMRAFDEEVFGPVANKWLTRIELFWSEL